MANKVTTIADWLLDARDLVPGEQLNIYLWDHKGPPPAYSDMRASLYAQFGEDTPIQIWKHGERICIFIHGNEADRERFDLRSAAMVIKKGRERVEIENGFTRALRDAG